MFAFGGLMISLIIGLFCMVNCFSAFASSALPGNNGNAIAYGVGYLLIGGLLILLALAGVVFLVISLIKKKEFKVPIPAICVLAAAGVLFLGYDIMVMVSNGTGIANAAQNIGQYDGKYDAYYIMSIVTNLLDIFTVLFITLLVAALGVFSLITIKKKKAEPKDELGSELD